MACSAMGLPSKYTVNACWLRAHALVIIVLKLAILPLWAMHWMEVLSVIISNVQAHERSFSFPFYPF
ncbi:rCG23114 [Rattus norvegicus]|uniref:RCG23114 n=1 Tax=Rattus norvegicus TaxID=10116 RepID=A6KN58_RAT|nr:rCG23114 [Rattus norvegicus]